MDDTINVQARLSMKTLATLARAYVDKDNVYIKSKSDLIWKALEQLTALYVENGAILFEDTTEAIRYLDSIGLSLATSSRTKRQVQTSLVRATALADFGMPDFGATTTKKMVIENDRMMHKLASDEMRAMGLSPISFEEFMENKRQKQASEGERVALSNGEQASIHSPIDTVAYEEKERLRKEEEKKAASPEALLAAMRATSDIKKEG